MFMKKLISSVAAFAMTASMFAGLAVTAQADTTETLKYSEGFANYTTGEWLTMKDKFIGGATGDAPKIATDGDNEYWTWNPNNGNGRGFYMALPEKAVVDTSTERVKFDFVGWGLNYADVSGYYLLDGSGNQILRLTYPGAASSTTAGDILINGTAAALDGTNFSYAKANSTAPLTWYTFDAVLDFGLHTFSYTIYSATNPKNIVASASNVGFLNATASNLARLGFYYRGNTQNISLDNFETYSIVSNDAVYPYEMQYVCNEEVVYSEKGEAKAGAVISGSKDVLAANETKDGKKYFRVASEAPEFTVEEVEEGETNTFKVDVREAATYAVKLVPSTDASTIIASNNVIEGESWLYSYPAYLTDANNKVFASTSATSFNGSITPTKDETITLPYTAYTGEAWFFEGEANGGDGTTIDSAALSSGKAIRHISASRGSYRVVSVEVPETGIYTVTVRGVTNRTGEGTLNVYVNNTESDAIDTLDIRYATTNSGPLTQSKEEVELKAGDRIIVKGSGDNDGCDYILLEKTGEVEPELTAPEVTIEADWTYDEPGSTPAKTFIAKFTVGKDNYAVNGINWTVTIDGEVKGQASEPFNTIVSGTDIQAGLVVVYKNAASLEPYENVNAELTAANAEDAE